PARAAAPSDELAFSIFKELVEINTVTATGDTARAADAMAARLRAAGFPEADIHVFKPAPRKGNLVARLHGSGGGRPIMLLAHIDVVEARREDWSLDPFRLVEQDGYYYGRGTGDDKFMAAAFVNAFVRYRKEGYKPARDLILVLETDEETLDADAVGMRWLLANHRDLVDAEYALNEGGGAALRSGKPYTVGVQTSEKLPVGFSLEVKNAGGHSSLPVKDNAITRLSGSLIRLGAYDFPVSWNDTTRTYFTRSAALNDGARRADMLAVLNDPPEAQALQRLTEVPNLNAQMRTTCVATMLEGGHAVNALPQMARATVNCRILPGESVDAVHAALRRVVADEQVDVKLLGRPRASPASPLRPDVVQAIEKLSAEFWPGAIVLPTMSAGATTGNLLRSVGIPTYGHSGLAGHFEEPSRAHGKDERILVKSFYEGNEYLYRLVKLLAGGQ
ncbi:MAG TPA: M20/M25/M40 family metallo-hydrolase, partial [Usitatibacter sp.]|nr:M20/M25/M40 family metallo-hydrolase [Usitatibacter sp.]